MKVGDLVRFSKHNMYNKKLDIKWGLGLVTEVYNDHGRDNDDHDVEVWWAKVGTSRTIAEDVMEIVNEAR